MELKKFGRAVGLAAALAGGEACQTDAHPERTYSGVSSNADEPRELSACSSVVQREFTRWESRMNNLEAMHRAGVTIQRIRPVHLPNQISGLDEHPHLLRFEVTLSDGRTRRLDATLESVSGFGDDDLAQVFSRALENAVPDLVAFARSTE